MAVVASDAHIVGRVALGTRTVVHPRARIVAEGGPIELGEDCIVEELALVVNRAAEPMRLGAANRIACAAVVDTVRAMGSGNYIEPKAMIGPGVRLGSDCVVSAGVRIEGDIELDDRTVVWGAAPNTQTRVLDEAAAKTNHAVHLAHVACIADLLPRFHNVVAAPAPAPS